MYTWEQIMEIVKSGGHFERSEAVQKAYEAVSAADRAKFILETRVCIAAIDRKIFYTKNLYPYDFEPGIKHYTAWYIDSPHVDDCDQMHLEFCVPEAGPWLSSGPHDVVRFTNDLENMSIPEIKHFHLFFREHKRGPVQVCMPLYFAHFTRVECLVEMLSTKIGDVYGHMVPGGWHLQFPGVYFCPVFRQSDHNVSTNHFSDPDVGVCLIMSSDALHATTNWHYNFCDINGYVTDHHTVCDPSEIGMYEISEWHELVMHGSVSLENICAIVTNYAPLLNKTSVMGIPVLAEMPRRAPPIRMFNFVENMPLETPATERAKRTTAHFTI